MVKYFLILIFVLQVNASNYVVITHKSLQHEKISHLALKMIFLKKLKTFHGLVVVPVNSSLLSPSRKSFEKNILSMSRHKLQAFWIKQHYLGHRPPIILHSPKSILEFVNKVPGAIAYIPQKNFDTNMSNISIIAKWRD